MSANPSHTGFYSVSWSAVADADSYRLEQSENGGAWGQVNGYDGEGLSWNASLATNGNYAYRVAACALAQCSDYSASTAETVAIPPGKPGTPSLNPNPSHTGDYTVSWVAVANANGYRLDQETDGEWTQVSKGDSPWSASDQADGSYAYKVRACYDASCGHWSSVVTETVSRPGSSGAPSLNPNPSHNGDYTVTWDAVANADSYRLEQSTNGGSSWTPVTSGPGRSWSASGKDDGSYAYRVQACYGSACGDFGGSATETVLLPPAHPPTLSAPYTATMGKEFPVSWSAVSTTTNYELEQSFVSNFSGVSPVSEDSALYTYEIPRTEASPYYLFYRVRACNSGGCSGWSSVGQVRVNPNLHCTGPRCHPVAGGGPLAAPTVEGAGISP